MNRAERRAAQHRSPAQHLRYSARTVELSAPRIVVMANASFAPMAALKAWIDTYDDPTAPAMTEQMLVELSGLWLGLTRGLYLNGTPLPRDDERAGNNRLASLFAGAAPTKSDLQQLHTLAARLINQAIKVKGWDTWKEAATDLSIKNEIAKRQSDSYWLGGWKHTGAAA